MILTVISERSWSSASVFSFTDGDGSHGAYCHHSELLPDWSVRSAAASLPVAQPRDGHYLYRHPRGRAGFSSRLQHFVTAHKMYGRQKCAGYGVLELQTT